MHEYVLITAARNEEAHILKTLQSVVAQTRLPKIWIVVSDGSTDRTDELIRAFAAHRAFIRFVRLDNQRERSFSSKALALNTGYELIKDLQFGFIGILDADISIPPNYYEQLLSRFDADSQLGLAGGGILEEAGGRWQLRPGDSLIDVGGQMQLFRRECYDDVGGFPPLRFGGEDTFANVVARRAGWQVRVFPKLGVCHHRRTGTAGCSVYRARFRGGMCDYFLGYHPLYEFAKCIRRVPEPPYITGSLLRWSGYICASFKKESRVVPSEVVDFLRRWQMERLLSAGGNAWAWMLSIR